jgi:hypothetical protein
MVRVALLRVDVRDDVVVRELSSDACVDLRVVVDELRAKDGVVLGVALVKRLLLAPLGLEDHREEGVLVDAEFLAEALRDALKLEQKLDLLLLLDHDRHGRLCLHGLLGVGVQLVLSLSDKGRVESEEGIASVFLSSGVDLLEHLVDCHLGRLDLSERRRQQDPNVLNLANHRLVLVVVNACERLQDLYDLILRCVLRLDQVRWRALQ